MGKAGDEDTTPRPNDAPELVNPLDYDAWLKQRSMPFPLPPAVVAQPKVNLLMMANPLFGPPAPDDEVPLDGCLFTAGAVLRTMERLQETERVAEIRLLDALRTDQVWAWKQFRPNHRIKVAATDWIGGDIDLDYFREHGGGGVRLKDGKSTHQRLFLIPEDILEYWLEQQRPRTEIPTKAKHNGLNYATADLPLLVDMRRMIKAGTARSPEDAARAVVARAVGSGQEVSKVKRLAKHYRAQP